MQTDGTVRASYLDWTSLILVIVGAINWGLVGIGSFFDANWNVVNLIFGSIPTLEALIYVVVGLAGLYELYFAYQLYGARSESRMRERKTA
ncbi:DUF378 domain-containing protein [Halorarius litoreus]|uniref:DUF378 domain-containing protein n=1 Tax=Halorarius litoreus TaxID=2962676 RepID=UPI0020CC9133|nr:DUF378 domain-containing protein [Halorarius litoreus]